MFSRYKVAFGIPVLIIIALVLFLIFRPKSPDADKFVEVYVQLTIAQTEYQNDPQELAAERKRIFAKYKYSQKELDRLIKYYEKHPDEWVQLWEGINERLSELIEKQKAQPSK